MSEKILKLDRIDPDHKYSGESATE